MKMATFENWQIMSCVVAVAEARKLGPFSVCYLTLNPSLFPSNIPCCWSVGSTIFGKLLKRRVVRRYKGLVVNKGIANSGRCRQLFSRKAHLPDRIH